MGLYDSYQLANSRLNRQYTGNTINELARVSDVMQNRYDASELGMEGLGQFLTDAKALPQDQQLLQDRSKGYYDQLGDWSKRKDLENVTKDVARAGRSFANEYKNFADRYSEAQAYNKEIENRVEKGPGQGGVSRATGDALLAIAHENYKGMQYDPTTHKYEGQFHGTPIAPEVDIPKWVNTVLEGIAADGGGTLVKSPAGDYFIKKGNTTEYIKPEKIKATLDAAMNSDPEIQGHIRQAGQIAAWKGAKMGLGDLDEGTQQKVAQEAQKQGVSPSQIIGQIAGQNKIQNITNNIYQLGLKRSFNKETNSFEYDGLTVEGQHKANRPYKDQLLELTTTQPGGGIKIDSGEDFDQLKTDTQAGLDQSVKDYSDVLTRNKKLGKGVIQDNGRFYRVNNDGTHTEITSEVKPYQDAVEQHKQLMAHNTEIENRAKTLSGFGEAEKDKALLKKAQDAYEKAMPRSDEVEGLSGADRELIVKQAKQQAYNDVLQNTPAYKDYVEELKKSLNNPAQSSTIYGIADANDKKAWSEAITDLTSKVGFENGVLPLKIGSGEDQGQQVSAKDYDAIKGDIRIVGPTTDQEGNIVMVARADQGKGKNNKLDGKDLILQIPETGVEKFLQEQVASGTMRQEQVIQLHQEGYLKSRLHAGNGQTQIAVPGTNGQVVANIQLRDNKWVVTYPLANGNTKEVVALSYPGVLSSLQAASEGYTKAQK